MEELNLPNAELLDDEVSNKDARVRPQVLGMERTTGILVAVIGSVAILFGAYTVYKKMKG